MASDRYNEIFAVIVRPNSGNDLNEQFIVNDICKGKFLIFIGPLLRPITSQSWLDWGQTVNSSMANPNYDQIISGKNENYKKVYANNFVSGMETARKEIAKAINAIQK